MIDISLVYIILSIILIITLLFYKPEETFYQFAARELRKSPAEVIEESKINVERLLSELNYDKEVVRKLLDKYGDRTNPFTLERKLKTWKLAGFSNQKVRYLLGIDIDPQEEEYKRKLEEYKKRSELNEH